MNLLLAQNENTVLDWIKRDLKKIINICHNNGLNIIIQNYPHRKEKTTWVRTIEPVNNVISSVASEEKIYFVDNKLIFDLKGKKLNDYLEPINIGEHCNSTGYQLMAKNVFDIIVKNNLFDIKSNYGNKNTFKSNYKKIITNYM